MGRTAVNVASYSAHKPHAQVPAVLTLGWLEIRSSSWWGDSSDGSGRDGILVSQPKHRRQAGAKGTEKARICIPPSGSGCTWAACVIVVPHRSTCAVDALRFSVVTVNHSWRWVIGWY